MSSTEVLDQLADTGQRALGRRLLVTRRSPSDKRYRALGYLDRTTDSGSTSEYRFRYLASAATNGIVPLTGFSDLERDYRSPRLFPSFAERVMSAKRPDRPAYLESLDLAESADSWEILAASGGHREGDPIELIPLPSFDQGTGETTAHFLAHGVSHRGPKASAIIDGLEQGTQLDLVPDPQNPAEPRAIGIESRGTLLGYVPQPLLDHVHSVIANDGHRLTVIRANSAETHPHLRLLLRLKGRVGSFVFDDPEWRPAE
ncbi:HIRAN domain-containing protein [Gordonia sp. (in: high G+C Gram-positive bacteria)]|uniref:HIRAN domain-containing protein n=1 Tax=Gordonia sp. (in: high G+C Gram-positive bacteria) TaxID=84139 RepID=UPI0016B375E9|nr:HIRAN domain-containing protein [Gordonia sp. (in: high G+C Gram-positive bacteria)]NLG45846.1 hypothetical protein [Gordonia sp. (in: high G+C Gram-positive bacteria)]